MSLRAELLLVALPTVTVLAVFALVEALTRQRLLFASLASSAFLIYLDPEHPTNQVKTLIVSQIGAAFLGYLSLAILGPGYAAAAVAMLLTTTALVALNVVHPPAISSALAFAFQDTKTTNVVLFALAVGMIAILVMIERACLWMVRRSRPVGAQA
jgi:CBS-domain-containing membrane protein